LSGGIEEAEGVGFVADPGSKVSGDGCGVVEVSGAYMTVTA